MVDERTQAQREACAWLQAEHLEGTSFTNLLARLAVAGYLYQQAIDQFISHNEPLDVRLSELVERCRTNLLACMDDLADARATQPASAQPRTLRVVPNPTEGD